MKLRSGRIIGTDDLTMAQKITLVKKNITEYIERAYNTDDIDKKLLYIADLYLFGSGPLFRQVLPFFQRFQDLLIKKSSEHKRELTNMIDTQRLLPTNKAYIRLTQSIDGFLKSLPNV
jgi:hypothetical protein